MFDPEKTYLPESRTFSKPSKVNCVSAEKFGESFSPAQSPDLFLSIQLTDQVALISTPASLC